MSKKRLVSYFFHWLTLFNKYSTFTLEICIEEITETKSVDAIPGRDCREVYIDALLMSLGDSQLVKINDVFLVCVASTEFA